MDSQFSFATYINIALPNPSYFRPTCRTWKYPTPQLDNAFRHRTARRARARSSPSSSVEWFEPFDPIGLTHPSHEIRVDFDLFLNGFNFQPRLILSDFKDLSSLALKQPTQIVFRLSKVSAP
jgi:hypothetical protein